MRSSIGLDPGGPGRVERRTLLVRAVEQHRDRGPGGGDRAVAARRLRRRRARCRTRAAPSSRSPRPGTARTRRRRPRARRPGPSGPARRRPTAPSTGRARAEAFGLQHLDDRAVPLDLLAAEQRLHRAHVRRRRSPTASGRLPERVPAGEAGADADHDASGRERFEPGDRRGRGHRVAQARDQHARAEADAARALGAARERHEHLGVQRGGVVEPGPPVAELLGERDVIGRVHRGGERGRRCPRRNLTTRLRPPASIARATVVDRPGLRPAPDHDSAPASGPRSPGDGRGPSGLRPAAGHHSAPASGPLSLTSTPEARRPRRAREGSHLHHFSTGPCRLLHARSLSSGL